MEDRRSEPPWFPSADRMVVRPPASSDRAMCRRARPAMMAPCGSPPTARSCSRRRPPASRFRARGCPTGAPLPYARVGARAAAVDRGRGGRDRRHPRDGGRAHWVALLLVPPGARLPSGGRHAGRARPSPCSRSRCWRSHGWRPTRASAARRDRADRRVGDHARSAAGGGHAAAAAARRRHRDGARGRVAGVLRPPRGAERAPHRRVPGHGLPAAPVGLLRHSGLGYGDFFAAAVVGGILAAERGPQLAAALGMVAVSLCWDQLFLVYDVLPATIPPAVVLIAVSFHGLRGLSRRSRPTSAPSRA